MSSWDVRLITASYNAREEDGVVVELYGKTKERESITIRYENFRPYFYIIEPSQSAIGELKKDGEVIKVEGHPLFIDGNERGAVKVTLHHPWLVPDYRKRYGGESKVLASDIPFHDRFIYDMDLGSCVRVRGEEVGKELAGKYTTDIVVLAQKFEECRAFKPPLKFLSFDIENSLVDNRLYTICCSIRDEERIEREQLTGTEKEMLREFEKLIQEWDPDIITGYNIDGYDIPQIKERAKKLGVGDLKLGRDFSFLSPVGDRFWRLHGRIVADTWWNAKLELRPKQETLNYLARLVLGEEKGDVDPRKIDEEWKKDPKKVLEYCSRDAELSLRILEKIGVIEKAMDLATVSKLPLDEVLNGRTSALIDSILIREADRHNIGVPQTKHIRDKEKIEGGYVHSINPGLYHWVCVLDFKSMYPSIIISKNICFTTLNEKGEIKAPGNIRFLSAKQNVGLLPRILKRLMEEREEIKMKMKSARDVEERNYYDGLQFAIKTLMNAFYGVFASDFYRFTNPKIGGSITAFARESIMNVISQLESEGITVIYSDTDSVFVQSPYDNIEDTRAFGESLSQRFSKEGITLEFDRILEPFFSHGKKKRYVGKVVWPTADVLVRGYEIRRTDAFEWQSEALTMVFDEVLKNDLDGALRVARKLVSDTMEGNVPIEKLVISRTCKDYDYYKDPESLTNVQVAKKMEAMGHDFVPGMKVSWIVTDGKKSPQEVEPFIDGREFKEKPDHNYYARRVASTLARVTEVFGWDENSLMGGGKQKTLFKEEFESRPVSSGEEEKKGKKLKSLEEFM